MEISGDSTAVISHGHDFINKNMKTLMRHSGGRLAIITVDSIIMATVITSSGSSESPAR